MDKCRKKITAVDSEICRVTTKRVAVQCRTVVHISMGKLWDHIHIKEGE